MAYSRQILFLVLSFFSSILFANVNQDEYQVVRDSKGMPRCVRDQSDHGLAYLFLWDDRDLYKRDIYAVNLDDIPLSASENKYRNCTAWGVLTSKAAPHIDKIAFRVDPEDREVGSFQLTEETLRSFELIRKGATLNHPYKTPEEFLSTKAKVTFNRALNREIAENFGMEFSIRIFERWILNNPTYAALDQHLSVNLAQSAFPLSLRDRLAGLKILLVPGFMQTASDERLQKVSQFLVAEGVSVEYAETQPSAPVTENGQRLQQQLWTRLGRGENLVVIAVSKGVPETLLAISSLTSALPGLPGKIRSFVAVNGVMEGSFAADWAVKFPQVKIIEKTLREEAQKKGFAYNPQGLRSITTDGLAQALTPIRTMPPEIHYFSLMNLPFENGLCRDSLMAGLQNSFTRLRIGYRGINDGYLETPASNLDGRFGVTASVLLLDGSHSFVDSRKDGLDMMNPQQAPIFLRGLFHTFADQITGI